ncbi:MAG TPA: energy transducer TonB [Acidobacteriota bacterium]|nr:energy transducer TonB [Acidobacteriota bacterium]
MLVSAGVHITVLVLSFATYYWFIQAVRPPVIPVKFYTAFGPPPAPAMAVKKPGASSNPPKPVTPKQNFQPTVIPEGISMGGGEEYEDEGGGSDQPIAGIEGGAEGGVYNSGTGFLSNVGGVMGGGEAVSEEGAPMKITAEMERPHRIKIVKPEYSSVAMRSQIQGDVVLQAVISETGVVEDVQIVKPLNPMLDKAAVTAVRQWLYKPAMFNGRPVRVYLSVTITFRISQSNRA